MLAAFNAYRRAGGRSMNSEHHQPMNHHHLVQPPTCHQQGADSREDHQTSSEFAVSKEDYLFRNEYFSLSMNLLLVLFLLCIQVVPPSHPCIHMVYLLFYVHVHEGLHLQ
ncbi:unnamed protein product [Musa hybrid cultivar]